MPKAIYLSFQLPLAKSQKAKGLCAICMSSDHIYILVGVIKSVTAGNNAELFVL